jgi:uncharacterized protein (TIGR03437 family)
LNRSRYFVGVAALAVLLCAGAASAQTSANVSVVSGNGQLVCGGCVDPSKLFFEPLIVRVTDANGQPLAFTSVHWAVTSGGFYGQLLGDTSFTDGNGYASINFLATATGFGTPFSVSQTTTIVASVGNSTATFTLTQGIQPDKSFTNNIFINPFVFRTLPDSANITAGSLFTGQVGTTSRTPIRIQIVTFQTGTPVPNVAVRLVNVNPGTGTIVCATQAGAGDNTVLTDENGIATCNPIFGGAPNVEGNAYVSVGGGFQGIDFTLPPTSFVQSPFPGVGLLVVRTTPGIPGALRLISGNGQSQQAGQTLSAPLVVQVQSTGGGVLAGQIVDWTLAPVGSALLGTGATTTDTNGNATNTVTLSSQASGPINVTARLRGSNLTPITFNVTAVPNITITGLNVVSGNNQSALVNTAFGAPLLVQLNASNGVAAGISVAFTISGPASLSASTVTTGSNGQAQVSVLSAGTPGNVTVTASAAGFSQTFNLVVSPPGPSLQTNSFMNAADFQRGALSPCALATIVAPGLAPGLQGMVTGSLFGPLPYQLAGDTLTVGGSSAPIFSIGLNTATNQQQLTFQVPCDVTPGSSVPVVVNVGAGNGTINIPIQAASPGIFQTVMSDGVPRAVLVRPDGSFVSLQNPARRGENLIAFLTGLGPATTPVSTNSVAAPGAVVTPRGTVVVGMAGRGIPLISAQLSDELLGVWLVTFTVPTDVNTGNLTFSVSVVPAGSGAPISSATTTIPVQ